MSKVVGKAIQPFEDMGNKVGSLAMSMPKYTPIPGLGGMSAGTLAKIPQKLESSFETSANEKAADSALGIFVGMDGRLSKDYAALKTAQSRADLSINELKALQANVRSIVGTK